MENRYKRHTIIIINNIITLRRTYIVEGRENHDYLPWYTPSQPVTKASTSTLRGWHLDGTLSRYGLLSSRYSRLRRTNMKTRTSKRYCCLWPWFFYKAVGPGEKMMTIDGSPVRLAFSHTILGGGSSLDRTFVAAHPSTVRPTVLEPVLCTACIRPRTFPVRAVEASAPRPSNSVSGTWPSSPGYRLFPVC